MTPKILSSCHPVGQPDSMTISCLVTLLMGSARHVIKRMMNLRFLSDMATHDVASTIYLELHLELHGDL